MYFFFTYIGSLSLQTPKQLYSYLMTLIYHYYMPQMESCLYPQTNIYQIGNDSQSHTHNYVPPPTPQHCYSPQHIQTPRMNPVETVGPHFF